MLTNRKREYLTEAEVEKLIAAAIAFFRRERLY
jgi:hypothetical protein